ncbi:efflux RND transporter periplasmic adaptor subunit [Paenibacillus sp. NPDC056579]|uniref:efflux RND transporter periplasmic adaptor subunit n=1 Tax=Paenibacillus sp. NPDC056579 TaxID=3345871 RepID=UPI0036CAA5D6
MQPGEFTQTGIALLTNVKMDQVQVELSVPEVQNSKIKTGYNIEVEVGNLPDKTFTGKVTEFSSTAGERCFFINVPVDVLAAIPSFFFLSLC